MDRVLRVAVDAMGGDLGPMAAVEGAVEAARELAIPVVIVGDERVLREGLSKMARSRSGVSIEICHAPTVVEMTDVPSRALRQKKDSSIAVAMGLIKRGEASAMVSPGNTGAVMAFGLHVLKRLPGVERPAIASVVPTLAKGEAVMLDMGANVDCKPTYLAQFALMGEAYARMVQGKTRPRVGLLSNGAEAGKGNQLTREAARLLRAMDIDFAGYVEGRDLFRGDVDVIVQDGFVGNVVLKTIEGAVDAIRAFLKVEIERSVVSKAAAVALKPAFERFKRRVDWSEYGGAPLLGLRGSCVVCHGASPPKAFKNAIRTASRLASTGVGEAIATQIRKNGQLLSGRSAIAMGRRGNGGRGLS